MQLRTRWRSSLCDQDGCPASAICAAAIGLHVQGRLNDLSNVQDVRREYPIILQKLVPNEAYSQTIVLFNRLLNRLNRNQWQSHAPGSLHFIGARAERISETHTRWQVTIDLAPVKPRECPPNVKLYDDIEFPPFAGWKRAPKKTRPIYN